MKWRANRPQLFTLLALALAILSMSATSRAETAAGPRNAVVLIIRHAEQPEQGDGLSPAGEARAKAYINVFKSLAIDGRPLKLDYIFAAADSRESRRPRLTVEPTAQALGLAVDDRYPNKHYADLVSRIATLKPGASTLICWHHGEIPNLLAALGADPGMLLHHGKWPADEYGWLIILRYDENGQLRDSKRVDEGR